MKNLHVPRKGGATRETVMLRWVVSEGVTGYHVERGPAGGQMALVAVVPGPSFLDHDLIPNTRYVYRVTEMRPEDYEPTDEDDTDVMRTFAVTLPELEYATREEFFTGFLSPTIARPTNSVVWCDHWTAHPEAYWLVGELWNSYEASRPLGPPAPPDGGRMAWAVHYLYPALDRLMVAQGGTFTGCGHRNQDTNGSWHESPMECKPLPG